jgi:two-component system LytT family response regulator
MRVMLVDDERLARTELRRLLASYSGVEIVAEVADGPSALANYAELRPDVVFLDVEMPGMSGLEVACALEGQTHIVFCTAFSQFASQAFDLNAADYLVKPVVPARLAQTVARLQCAVTSYLPESHRVLLKRGERLHLVALASIRRFDAVGNYIQLSTPDGQFLMAGSLSKLEPRLDPAIYFRTGRSNIVRYDAIASIECDVGRGLLLKLVDGEEVPVSRRQAQLLRDRFTL